MQSKSKNPSPVSTGHQGRAVKIKVMEEPEEEPEKEEQFDDDDDLDADNDKVEEDLDQSPGAIPSDKFTVFTFYIQYSISSLNLIKIKNIYFRSDRLSFVRLI